MKFSYRKYQAGDEVAINELYHAVTGRTRSVKEHAWQWLQTPAGESEMWLIEAELKKGEKKLIGHHGVMALDFSHYGKPMRVGKTENTMVLPEFREKILYPRFEKKFLSLYEKNFHALFSTIGPDPAIRLRKAMGYEANHHWKKVFIGNEPALSLITINNTITRKFYNKKNTFLTPSSITINNTKIDAYSDSDACTAFDYDGFWDEISLNYPLTPARNIKNLSWRYWKNPYRKHLTLVLNNKELGIAICVLSFRKSFGIYIEDIYCKDKKALPSFLEILYAWSKKKMGCFAIETYTTSDNMKYFHPQGHIRDSSWLQKLFNKNNEVNLMPRKVTSAGKAEGIKAEDDWYVTPFYFEGR